MSLGATSTHLLNTFRSGDSTTSLGSLFQCLITLFGEEIFPNIQSKPPLTQLETVPFCPVACYLGEETDTHIITSSFQIVVENKKVSPQPPFLLAKQPLFPQPLLIRFCARPFTNFVALLWTCSSTSMSLL